MAEEILVPKKLLVIAVDVETGTIKEPDPADNKPRVVGIVDEKDFDDFIAGLAPNKKEKPKKADHTTSEHPYVSDDPRPKQIATILHTHHSPGCCWVIVNGWPFCIRT
jgi:predicted component of type VI protein secretion system